MVTLLGHGCQVKPRKEKVMTKQEAKDLVQKYKERIEPKNWPKGKLSLSNQYGMIFLLTEDNGIFMRIDKLIEVAEKALNNEYEPSAWTDEEIENIKRIVNEDKGPSEELIETLKRLK